MGQRGSRHLMLFTTSLVWTRFSGFWVLSKADEYKYVSMGVFSLCMWSHSVMSNSLWAHEAPPTMAFSRQEYWSGLPFHSSGDLPDPGIETTSPILQVDSLLLSHQGSLRSTRTRTQTVMAPNIAYPSTHTSNFTVQSTQRQHWFWACAPSPRHWLHF